MITGNHDCLADYSIYHHYDPTEAGEHLHFIKTEVGDVLHFEDLGVSVWGRSMIDHHPEHKPLADVPESSNDHWYVGVTHGYYVNRGLEMYSSLITPEEIEQSDLDYLALGHVHVYSTMQHGKTLAAYPGSPNLGQGGKEMTAALVSLDPEQGVSSQKLVLPGSP